MLVEPGTLNGTPAVTTILSLLDANPFSLAARAALTTTTTSMFMSRGHVRDTFGQPSVLQAAFTQLHATFCQRFGSFWAGSDTKVEPQVGTTGFGLEGAHHSGQEWAQLGCTDLLFS